MLRPKPESTAGLNSYSPRLTHPYSRGNNTIKLLDNNLDTAEQASPLSDASFRAIFEIAPNPMGVVELLEDDILHLADNAAAGQLFNHSPQWMLRKRATEIGIPSDAVCQWLGHYRKSKSTGLPQRFEYAHQTATLRVLLLVTVCHIGNSPTGRPRFSYVAEDVTSSRRTQAALQWRVHQYEELHADAERHQRELALRDKVRTAVMQELDPSAVIRTVVESIAEILGYTHVGIYLVRGRMLELQHHVGYDDVITHIPLNRGIMGKVARTGKSILLEDVSKEPTFISATNDVVSEICVPLFEGEKVAGILNVESTGGLRLTRDDLETIIAMSEFISIALGRARLYAEMKESKERFQAFMNNSPALAFIKDAEGKYVYVNEPFERAFGLSASDLIGKNNTCWLPEKLAMHIQQHDQVVLSTGTIIEVTETIPTANGVPHDWLVYKFPISDAGGQQLVGSVAIDITVRKQAEDELHQLAIRDELTGLYNRREMRRLIEEAAERFQTYGHSAALIMLDIDHFKLVNDNYGHKVGDRVLQWLAQMLHTQINRLHSLARYGGEELAIILPDTTESEALAIAEYIREAIAAHPYRLSRSSDRMLGIPLTVSLGVAALSGDIDCEDALIAAADAALYEAKRQGRNRAVLFDSEGPTTMTFLTSGPLRSDLLPGH
ncbi:MAG TPA: diguanylate cyclase [Chloroflexia bacterium]|nr:diguanylate cyclase [Chloroflexia bacterium]